MGEIQKRPFQLSFNVSLKVGFQGSRVTSDGGLILVRELDERLGFGELIAQHLTDSRGKNGQFDFADLLRQSVYSRLAGYEDLNDAERLSQDPTFRLIGSEKIWDRGAALTSRLQSFETEMLAQDSNFAGLAGLSRALIAKAEALDSGFRTVLDMDSTEIPLYLAPAAWLTEASQGHGKVESEERFPLFHTPHYCDELYRLPAALH
jgi:hypothetical protein